MTYSPSAPPPTPFPRIPISRRGFIGTGLASGIAMASAASAQQSSDDDFSYEVTRTEAEWKEQLGEADYRILREGATEVPKSNPLWEETADGAYACKGCDLHAYDANWKVVLDKGWAFFRHGVPNAHLTGIDGPVAAYGQVEGPLAETANIEVHCRRCGSHMGHVLLVDDQVLHCINGSSLTFTPVET